MLRALRRLSAPRASHGELSQSWSDAGPRQTWPSPVHSPAFREGGRQSCSPFPHSAARPSLQRYPSSSGVGGWRGSLHALPPAQPARRSSGAATGWPPHEAHSALRPRAASEGAFAACYALGSPGSPLAEEPCACRACRAPQRSLKLPVSGSAPRSPSGSDARTPAATRWGSAPLSGDLPARDAGARPLSFASVLVAAVECDEPRSDAHNTGRGSSDSPSASTRADELPAEPRACGAAPPPLELSTARGEGDICAPRAGQEAPSGGGASLANADVSCDLRRSHLSAALRSRALAALAAAALASAVGYCVLGLML